MRKTMTESDLSELTLVLGRMTHAAPAPTTIYDGMSDAIVWSDEFDGLLNVNTRIVWKLRPILRARTCIITSKPVEFEAELVALQSVCKDWIGFREERMKPSETLAIFFAQEHLRFSQQLERL